MLSLKKIPLILSMLFFVFIILIIGCFELSPSKNVYDSYSVRVIKIIDGDTIKVSFPNESIGTIRLLGIDCPETTIENNAANEYEGITSLGCLTSYGNKAKSFITSILNNSQITIHFDNQTDRKDKYDRYLCYVFLDDMDVNKKLLDKGYARVFTIETFEKKQMYLESQQQAMDQSKGLWNCTLPMEKITIETVHYNALGNDEENLNDEYIVLLNENDESVDLTGWSIQDEHGNQFDFPIGFTLHSYASVTIYTGQGTNGTTALYWYHDTPVWNNDEDTVRLYNEKNVLVETFVW